MNRTGAAGTAELALLIMAKDQAQAVLDAKRGEAELSHVERAMQIKRKQRHRSIGQSPTLNKFFDWQRSLEGRSLRVTHGRTSARLAAYFMGGLPAEQPEYLTPREWHMLTMHVNQGLTMRDIAWACGLSDATVCVLVSRAITLILRAQDGTP